MMTSRLEIRPVTELELSTVYTVQWRATQDETDPTLLPHDHLPSKLYHQFQEGQLLLAQDDASGSILGYGGILKRSGVTLLSSLYVTPEAKRQKLGVGVALLKVLLSSESGVRCAVQSGSPEVIVRSSRAGLLPRWPLLILQCETSQFRTEHSDLGAISADYLDLDLIEWDAEISGRGARTGDHKYWVQKRGAEAFWFERNGLRIGYGYIQHLSRSVDRVVFDDHVFVGPVGAKSPEDAVACLLAAIDLARLHAGTLLLSLPGMHPVLPKLLTAGFRIGYVGMYYSSSDQDVFDPRCYVPGDSATF